MSEFTGLISFHPGDGSKDRHLFGANSELSVGQSSEFSFVSLTILWFAGCFYMGI
jgi:hypothetical protein